MIEALKIHKQTLTMDTHADIYVGNFSEDRNYTQNLHTQITLPKMQLGGLDVIWFAVFTKQGKLDQQGYKKAWAYARKKFEAIHWLCRHEAYDRIELATSVKELKRIRKDGKLVAMVGIENAFPIGKDLERIETFYNWGARYMGLSHNGHNQLCDSHTGAATGQWLHKGLSEFGKNVIREMNRLGIIADVSHLSKKSFIDIVELSQAPIVASHSSASALCDISRNLDDEQLKLLQKNGGVAQAVALRRFVNSDKTKIREKAMREVLKSHASQMGFKILNLQEIQMLDEGQQDSYRQKLAQLENALSKTINEKIDPHYPDVDVSDFVDHIDHMVDLIGIDHVGISSDFDGGGGVKGWDDASESLNVTIELLKRGYDEESIGKLWGRNFLRVLENVEAVARASG